MPFLAHADRRDAMSEFVTPITLASMRANASWKAVLPTPADGDGARYHASENTRPLGRVRVLGAPRPEYRMTTPNAAADIGNDHA